MDEQLVQIREYSGEGYRPLIDFGAWRVALMRNADRIEPERLRQLERHLETDEVFILLDGWVILVIGVGGGHQVDRLEAVRMEKGKVYNIRSRVWHTIVMSKDACVAIVENSDTSEKNSQILTLSAAQCDWVLQLEHS